MTIPLFLLYTIRIMKKETAKLYLKTHNKTGMKYLGITTGDPINSYKGSGAEWKKHILSQKNQLRYRYRKKHDNKKISHTKCIILDARV